MLGETGTHTPVPWGPPEAFPWFLGMSSFSISASQKLSKTIDHKDALGMLLRMREVTDLESWSCCSLAGVAALVVSAKLECPKTRQVVLLRRMRFCSRRRAAA